MDYADIEREKKATKIFYRTARIAGCGIGCFVLALIMPLINTTGITADLQGLFIKYGLYALACVSLVMGTYLFVRKHIFTINIIMQWIILPSIALSLAMDIYSVMTSVKEPINIEIPISDPRGEE